MRDSGSQRDAELPAVDERLVAPESRYEIIDGRIEYVAPADEPHGTRHATVATLLKMHARDEFDVAIDMLTRTSETNDIAPDVSVFPRARDEQTGGRQLEHLAFEVVSTQRLSDAGKKAARLAARGVRRVFAVDVERERLLVWSTATESWEILPRRGDIEDETLVAPLPIEALVEAVRYDEAIARVLIQRNNPVIVELRATERAEGHAEGRAEGMAAAVVAVLTGRGIALDDDTRRRILATREEAALDRWLRRAGTCADVADLFAD